MDNESLAITKGRFWTREMLVTVLRLGLEEKCYHFVRQAALAWLNEYPGDLEVSFTLAQSFLGEGREEQGVALLQQLLQVDPEFVEAWQCLLEPSRRLSTVDGQTVKTACFVLSRDTVFMEAMPEWSEQLRTAREAMLQGALLQAEESLFRALTLAQDQILIAVTHVKLMRDLRDWLSLLRFVSLYRQRWPDCLVFHLAQAESKLALGDEAEGVSLLHRCIASDIAAHVARQWFGEGHPYLRLWPDQLGMTLEIPIPAEVSRRLGWNRLPGKSESDKLASGVSLKASDSVVQEKTPPEVRSDHEEDGNGLPEEAQSGDVHSVFGREQTQPIPKSPWVHEIENELEVLAKRINRPGPSKTDGRYPIYVVFSSYQGLVRTYGEQTARVIFDEMHRLSRLVARASGWGGVTYLPDERTSCEPLGLPPIAKPDAWSLKLALADLDKALGKQGGRIGAVLIVGGDEVVPFHRLPNPTDDLDHEVLSDNPYATRDGNYFVPEWPVGRIPGGKGADAGLILQTLRMLSQYHERRTKRLRSWQVLWRRLFGAGGRRRRSLGYSAAVWRRASLATSRPLGRNKVFWTSPPFQRETLDPRLMVSASLGYYNLHGLSDAPEWYGQKDPSDGGGGPDYPVALSPQDLTKNGSAPRIVFTEACYGGYVIGKDESDSLTMRFLHIGTLAVVGSTAISYGAVQSPLVGADLLGYFFWNGLKAGYSVGEALLHAKVNLVREMTRRQGFLDGEDQKTLISFTLFGDPLVYAEDFARTSKHTLRFVRRPMVKTAVERPDGETVSDVTTQAWVAEAKRILEPFLPGLEQAEWQVNLQQVSNPTAAEGGRFTGEKAKFASSGGNVVLVFRQSQQVAGRTHHRFARVTLNREGKLMKVSLSH